VEINLKSALTLLYTD